MNFYLKKSCKSANKSEISDNFPHQNFQKLPRRIKNIMASNLSNEHSILGQNISIKTTSNFRRCKLLQAFHGIKKLYKSWRLNFTLTGNELMVSGTGCWQSQQFLAFDDLHLQITRELRTSVSFGNFKIWWEKLDLHNNLLYFHTVFIHSSDILEKSGKGLIWQ